MKRTICLILAAIICAAFASCAATDGERNNTASSPKSAKDVIKDMIDAENTDEGAATAADAAEQAAPAQEAKTQAKSADGDPSYDGCDVDLTALSSTMVYSEVYNMLVQPDEYVGKTVKMSGTFNVSHGAERDYYFCLIADATACCSQGMEFILGGGRQYPDDYPSVETEITVTGIFDIYYEGSNRYCQLIDAVMS